MNQEATFHTPRKRRSAVVGLCVFALLILAQASCGGSGGGGKGGGSGDADDNGVDTIMVSGIVVDSNGTAVPNATVTITSDPVVSQTDVNGGFTAEIHPGDHHIAVEKDGVVFIDMDFSASAGSDLDLGTLSPTTFYEYTPYTVGGTVSGLGGTLVLQNNSADDLTLTANGTFTFATAIADGADYDVTLLTQSAGQFCGVSNGSGTINGADVINVSVTCVTLAPVGAYYSNGADWNDYVKNDNTTPFDANDIACDGTETGGYSACLHSGEMRSVEVPTYTSCTGLMATDALGAFDWTCQVVNGQAMMVSTGLMEMTSLTGTADDTASGLLIHSMATFLSDGVEVGDTVINTTDYTSTTVLSIDSEIQLSLADDLFIFGESYLINRDRNLSDLINFSTPGWKSNSVTVTDGATILFTTASGAWWGNPVVIDNNGGSLSTTGTVYLVTTDPNSAYSLDANKISLVVQPGITLTGSGGDMIDASFQNFLWLEGRLDADGQDTGFYLGNTRFSVLRGAEADDADYNIRLNNSSNNMLKNIIANNINVGVTAGVFLETVSDYNTLENVTTSGNPDGVSLVSSSNNTLTNITAASNEFRGVWLSSSSNNNSLSNITAPNNGFYGVLLASSSNNSLSNITAASNENDGVFLSISSNNSLSNITATNNGDSGVLLASSSDNNSLSNITAANNGLIGVYLSNSSNNNSLSNITAANNGDSGVFLASSSNNSLSNITAANNGDFGVIIVNSSDNTFTGLLTVGNSTRSDCSDNIANTFSDTNCTAVSPSDFALTQGITLASSFVAKVGTNDMVNTSDSAGAASYPTDPAQFDWTGFDNAYRGWGIDGSAFPNADHRGQWTGATGRIWDWSVASTDSIIRGVLNKLFNGSISGDAANTIEHPWIGTAANQAACDALVPGSIWNAADDCRSTFMRNTSEIIDDGIGNDNVLCESGETCLFTPNIGSYQGHGTMQSAGTFTDGDTMTGVTLLEYNINGY